MFSNIYLSQRALKINPVALVFRPYKEGIENIKKAWGGKALRLYTGLPDASGPKEAERKLNWNERIKHLVVGLLLLVPVINTVALLILRKLGAQHPPSFVSVPVPAHYICWDRVPAPYAPDNLMKLDALEYRIHKGASNIEVRLLKENRAAREFDLNEQQVRRLYPQFFRKKFEEESEKVLKAPENRALHGEMAQQKGSYTTLNDLIGGVAEAQGRREEMEDTHLTGRFEMEFEGQKKTIDLSAIFDGHGGKGMSAYARAHLVGHLKKRLKEFTDLFGHNDEAIWNALKISLVDLSRSYNKDDAGATANICIKIGNKVWFDNLGDSRALILTSKGEVVQMTEDQKPNDPKYKKGVLKRGHDVFDRDKDGPSCIDGVLAVGRALGDHGLEGGVPTRPKVTCYTLPEEEAEPSYVIQACDGVWDVATTQQVGKLVQELLKKGYSLPAAAAEIAKTAFKAGSGDNLTVLIRKL
jgi:serine/threonine protein phosphatase PrpC